MVVSKIVNPLGSMMLLSQTEVNKLKRSAHSELYHLFRNCSLAILNSGVKTDDSKELFARYRSFDINILSRERGVKLELINPPENAFVDGKLIKTIHANLFSVLRDILFLHSEYPFIMSDNLSTDATKLTGIVFKILRNANVLHVGENPNLVVCWGGHSINKGEYLYARNVGLQIGLRELNICTGCGAGIMEAPMKGAAVGHAQQSYKASRFLGITEPSIIASEPPNPLVNELVIMPDIEKRLEAFVRLAHGIIIFPGGPGTAEELLYILGILMSSENSQQVLPLILTGSKESQDYFDVLETFLVRTFGEEVKQYYKIIIDDAVRVAQILSGEIPKVKAYRLREGDAFGFNWSLNIPNRLQIPFTPTHENMLNLNLHHNQSKGELAAALRCAFSGIVAGNIKEPAIQQIRERGLFQLHGEPTIMKNMDFLLKQFVLQNRMKLPNDVAYQPCYEILL